MSTAEILQRSEHEFWLHFIDAVAPGTPQIPRIQTEDGSASGVQGGAHDAIVNTLPLEILYEIMLHTSSVSVQQAIDQINSSDTPGLDFHFTPFHLAQVCAHWRSVACAFPLLWSTIFVIGPRLPFIKLIELALIRSGDIVPLNLTLHHLLTLKRPQPSYENQVISTNHILVHFARYAHRWKCLDLWLHVRDLGDLPLKPSSSPVPALESAKVFLTMVSEDVQHRFWSILNSSPVLKQAYFWTLNPPPSTPWAQLVDVQFCILSLDAFVAFMRQTTRLESLIVTLKFRLPSPAPTIDPVPLERLRTLDISFRDARVFDLITTPVLDSLIFQRAARCDEHSVMPFHNFLSRSGCTLGSVDLKLVNSTSYLYLATSSLDRLEMLRAGDGDISSLLAFLTWPPVQEFHIPAAQHPCSLPGLKSLVFDQCMSTPGLIGAMVKSRLIGRHSTQVIGQLELLDVSLLKDLGGEHQGTLEESHAEDFEALSELVDSGVRLRWEIKAVGYA
ncbi:hypothetical protein AX16_002438 [Volvariella volvacea WC 439]|nr:hypothetical protein AX16_002438 [Volvariella volvacea WC 439]